MSRISINKDRICINLLIPVLVLFSVNPSIAFSQPASDNQKLYFISDVQAPMFLEKLFLKS